MAHRNTLQYIFTFLLLTLTPVTTFTGSYIAGAPPVQFSTYTFTGASGNTVAQFKLTYSSINSLPQMLMIVKNTNTPPAGTELQISSYQHINPSSNVNYDFQHANTGQPQYVQLSPAPSATLYVFIINFNQQLAVSYAVTITEQPNYSNNLCLAGNPRPPSSIYCSNCLNPQYAGSFCDIPVSQMSNNVTYSLPLQAYSSAQGSFGATTLSGSTSQITLYFTATSNNIFNCIQFKLYNSEVAGIMNYAPTGGLNSLTQPNAQYSIQINSGGSDVSVSFANFNNYAVTINVWYVVSSSTNILLIVLAVLGGILFVGLVIVAICMVRRMRNNDEQRVSPLVMGSRTSIIRVGDNDLSVQEIETYFPGVLCRLVFPQEEASTNNLMVSPGNSGNVDRDCVICLCPITNTEIIKATYCRHFFHAQCLNKWFQKQRNCPYCREQYNKKSTVEHYQALLSLSHKNMLMGVDLVTEIIHSKQVKSNLVIQDIKQ